MSDLTIYWFRNDLRLSDLTGLCAAAERGPVLPVFIYDDQQGGDWAVGSASRWWLHGSLEALGADIARSGGKLLLRRGDCQQVLLELIEATGATAVMASKQYQPWSDALEKSIHSALAEKDVAFKRYPGTLLFEPGDIVSGAGTLFKVFTPFWRACLRATPPAPTRPAPQVTWATPAINADELDSWQLKPTQPNWAHAWQAQWQPGEASAAATLEQFLAERVQHYTLGRDFPAEIHTSRLSPHLRFGEISPRQVWHAAQRLKAQNPGVSEATDKFLSELGWREFSHQLLTLFPEMPERSFKSPFDFFPWQNNPDYLKAWQRGQTGYPIVDAGMRELWHTGFMHNRVRMITASFLTKHLLCHWQQGEQWFWDCLLDADLAANACSWQWVAGSGADASPYFRIFNPVAQGEKFDKAGEYTRKWVPEIAALPDKYLHKPWEAPELTLRATGVELGATYPHPVVDHKAAREAALAAYGLIKGL